MVNNTTKRLYTEVVWQWSEELNQMVEVSAAFEDYSGSWAYAMADTGDSILGAASTTTTHLEFVPELWSDGIYRFFQRGTIFKNLIEDYSSMVKGPGDTVNIPQIDLVAATDKAIDSLVTYDATHSTQTQLVINKHKYNAMLFEDVLMIQSNADLVQKIYSNVWGSYGESCRC